MNTKTNHFMRDSQCLFDQFPRVYLAGKIRQNCWRHRLIDGLRTHSWNDGPLAQEEFIYVGPFFVGCDHGCYHKGSTHGAGIGCTPDLDIHLWCVAQYCRNAVEACDLVFAFIESRDCHGTIAELERAHTKKIPVVIAFAPGLATPIANDFWFVCTLARSVVYDVDEDQLAALLRASLEALK